MPSRDAELANREAFDLLASEYSQQYLLPAERILLERLWNRWHQTDFLDLGVGAGRTTWTFGAITQRYVGIDYAPQMIDRARHMHGVSDRASFHVGDAADLSLLGDQTFDVALFSYNGIDYITHEKRLSCLREVRSRLRGTDSLFLFSSHNLHSFPFNYKWSHPPSLVRSGVQFSRDISHNYRVWRVNRQMSLEEVRKRSWAILNDGAHGFSLATYYVTPAEQVRQLEETGFELITMIDMAGRSFDWKQPNQDPHLHYLCRPTQNRKMLE